MGIEKDGVPKPKWELKKIGGAIKMLPYLFTQKLKRFLEERKNNGKIKNLFY